LQLDVLVVRDPDDQPGAMFLGGGTTLVDVMKIDVLTPDTVVSVRHLDMSRIDVSDDAIEALSSDVLPVLRPRVADFSRKPSLPQIRLDLSVPRYHAIMNTPSDPKLPPPDPDPERESPGVSPIPTREPDEAGPDVFDPGSEPLPA